MKTKNKILLVDDHIGDITWLVDYLENLSYEVHHITNEEAARRRFEEVKEGRASYALAVVDVMVSIKDIMDLVDLDESYYEESRETGLRLCRYARQELEITSQDLPIVSISARADHEGMKQALEELGVRLFSRVPQASEESIRDYLRDSLPKIE